MSKQHLIIVSSPSGGGKSTINRMFVETYPSFEIVTSFTTRSKRQGEENGREYFFIENNEFESRLARDEMLEHAYVHGKYYGTSRKEVERIWASGHTPILEIDVQGFETIQKLLRANERYKKWTMTSVFILPPSFEVLGSRLAARKSETEASLKNRLNAAKQEVKQSAGYDIHVLNDKLEDAFTDFSQAILGDGYDDAIGKTHLKTLCKGA